MFRRPRITINFLEGDLKDSRSPVDFSWLITPDLARAVRPLTPTIYKTLLKPPLKFILALIDEKSKHFPHLLHVNDFAKSTDKEMITADTPITFTFNCAPQTYTVYELEQTLLNNNTAGKMPGVQTLIKFFGPASAEDVAAIPPHEPVDPKKGKSASGRPSKDYLPADGRHSKRPVS